MNLWTATLLPSWHFALILKAEPGVTVRGMQLVADMDKTLNLTKCQWVHASSWITLLLSVTWVLRLNTDIHMGMMVRCRPCQSGVEMLSFDQMFFTENKEHVTVRFHAIFTHSKLNQEHMLVRFHAIFTQSTLNEAQVPVKFHAMFTCLQGQDHCKMTNCRKHGGMKKTKQSWMSSIPKNKMKEEKWSNKDSNHTKWTPKWTNSSKVWNKNDKLSEHKTAHLKFEWRIEERWKHATQKWRQNGKSTLLHCNVTLRRPTDQRKSSSVDVTMLSGMEQAKVDHSSTLFHLLPALGWLLLDEFIFPTWRVTPMNCLSKQTNDYH